MKNKETVLNIRIIVLFDIIALGILYLTPVLSHWLSLPLYKFEPMRCVLLINLLLTSNKRNAYIMAVTLPLFSFIVGSHPFLFKALLMAFELSANVLLFDLLSRKLNNCGFAMFVSILVSKTLYYLVKIGLISIGLMNTAILSTSIGVQLLIAAVLSLLFFEFSNKMRKE